MSTHEKITEMCLEVCIGKGRLRTNRRTFKPKPSGGGNRGTRGCIDEPSAEANVRKTTLETACTQGNPRVDLGS
jgi:hypothetical protein